jgi:hypothetical protein
MSATYFERGITTAVQAKPKMATEIPASITTPDRVETRLGTLKFFDGFPDDATVQTLYDNLDFQHGTQAFLTALPAASLFALRTGIRTFGPDNQTVLITEPLLDSRSLVIVANTETVYNFAWLSTTDSPLVIEVPSDVLGFINDFWGRYVTDVGRAGPDQGKGGKFLLLPPGYADAVPEDYFVVRSLTYGNLMFFRGFAVGGHLAEAVENSIGHFRIYPLAQVVNPPVMSFVNISGEYFNTILANDASFFEHVAQVVRDEPLDAVDPVTRGLLAAIGIRKDRPFAPDARMRRLLVEAAAVGNATARTLLFNTRDQDVYYYPDSAWKMPFIGNDPFFSPGGVYNLDAQARYFYGSWGISPAMAWKKVGIGSQYTYAEHDADGQYLDGAKAYRRRTSGPSLSTIRKRAPCSRQTSNSPAPAAKARTSFATLTARWISISAQSRLPARKLIGYRHSPAKGGSLCCGSTAQSSHGSTRLGGPARLRWWFEGYCM